MRTLFIGIAVIGSALIAAPASAGHRDRGVAPQNDSNPYWLDYRTDVSEAKRELRNDLEGASDEEDRRDAWEEYRQEIADAKADYRKEMRERGYSVGRVIVEDGD